MKRQLADYEAILCDLDGCLVAGNRVLSGARELVARFHKRLWVVSNNSTDTPATLAARLAGLDLALSPDRIVLAGSMAVGEIARQSPGARVSIFGSNALRTSAADLGLKIDDVSPECILLGRDLGFDFQALERLVRHLSVGVRLVVTNEDATHPGADGLPIPETGAIVAAVRACLPDITYECFGKPHAAIYEHALARAGVAPQVVLAIGDNPATDGRGAANAGLDFVLVGRLSGEYADIGALLAGYSFASGCSPPRLTATQLPSAT